MGEGGAGGFGSSLMGRYGSNEVAGGGGVGGVSSPNGFLFCRPPTKKKKALRLVCDEER